MRYLEIVLLIGFFLNGQGVFGKQLQWNTRLSRKLLLEGEAVTDKDDKMFMVSAGGKEFTGIGLKGKTIAIPSIHVKTAKIKSKTLSSKGTSGGFTFFGYDNAKQFADYASATGGLTKCFIYGFKDAKPVKQPTSATTAGSDMINLNVTFCEPDVGAALVCDGKLAGIVVDPALMKNKTDAAPGAGPAAEPAPGGEGATPEAGATAATPARRGPGRAPPRGRDDVDPGSRGNAAKEAASVVLESEVTTASMDGMTGGTGAAGTGPSAAGASGETGGPSTSGGTTAKKRRRKRQDTTAAEGSTEAAGGEGAGGAGGAGGCSHTFPAMTIKSVQEHAEKAGTVSTMYVPAATVVPAAVAFGLAVYLL